MKKILALLSSVILLTNGTYAVSCGTEKTDNASSSIVGNVSIKVPTLVEKTNEFTSLYSEANPLTYEYELTKVDYKTGEDRNKGLILTGLGGTNNDYGLTTDNISINNIKQITDNIGHKVDLDLTPEQKTLIVNANYQIDFSVSNGTEEVKNAIVYTRLNYVQPEMYITTPKSFDKTKNKINVSGLNFNDTTSSAGFSTLTNNESVELGSFNQKLVKVYKNNPDDQEYQIEVQNNDQNTIALINAFWDKIDKTHKTNPLPILTTLRAVGSSETFKINIVQNKALNEVDIITNSYDPISLAENTDVNNFQVTKLDLGQHSDLLNVDQIQIVEIRRKFFIAYSNYANAQLNPTLIALNVNYTNQTYSLGETFQIDLKRSLKSGDTFLPGKNIFSSAAGSTYLMSSQGNIFRIVYLNETYSLEETYQKEFNHLTGGDIFNLPDQGLEFSSFYVNEDTFAPTKLSSKYDLNNLATNLGDITLKTFKPQANLEGVKNRIATVEGYSLKLHKSSVEEAIEIIQAKAGDSVIVTALTNDPTTKLDSTTLSVKISDVKNNTNQTTTEVLLLNVDQPLNLNDIADHISNFDGGVFSTSNTEDDVINIISSVLGQNITIELTTPSDQTKSLVGGTNSLEVTLKDNSITTQTKSTTISVNNVNTTPFSEVPLATIADWLKNIDGSSLTEGIDGINIAFSLIEQIVGNYAVDVEFANPQQTLTSGDNSIDVILTDQNDPTNTIKTTAKINSVKRKYDLKNVVNNLASLDGSGFVAGAKSLAVLSWIQNQVGRGVNVTLANPNQILVAGTNQISINLEDKNNPTNRMTNISVDLVNVEPTPPPSYKLLLTNEEILNNLDLFLRDKISAKLGWTNQTDIDNLTIDNDFSYSVFLDPQGLNPLTTLDLSGDLNSGQTLPTPQKLYVMIKAKDNSHYLVGQTSKMLEINVTAIDTTDQSLGIQTGPTGTIYALTTDGHIYEAPFFMMLTVQER